MSVLRARVEEAARERFPLAGARHARARCTWRVERAGAAPPAPPGHARAHKPRRQPSGDLNLSGLGLSADGGSFDFAVADIFTGQRDQSMEIPYAGPGGRASVPSGLGAGAGGGAASGAPGAESRRQNSGVGDLMGDIIDGRNRSTSTDDI